MTLHVERFGEVIQVRMSSPGSRVAALEVSTYVIRGIMIDTGMYHLRRKLRAAVRDLGVRGAIVTHWHEDHAGNVEHFAAAGLPLHVRPDTEAILRRRPAIRLYRRLVWGRPAALQSSVVPLDLGALQAIHTPGHSADHQVVWDPLSRTLFSADLWLGVRARILQREEDPFKIVESLRVAAALEPEVMFDAHRGFVARPVEALRAKADWLSETLAEIERRLGEGWSEREILQRVLGGEDRTAYASGGEYSRRNLVRAVRARL